MSAFASRDTHTLPLESGESISIKKQLTIREARRCWSGEAEDRDFAFVREFLVSWGLKDETGQTVPYTAELLDALTPATFNEIVAAISTYLAETTKENPTNATA